MANTYKIVWSDEALSNLKQIVSYLEEYWTTREIKKFALLLDRQLIRIENNPQLFPKSTHKKNIRKSVLSRQISIYYGIHKFEFRIFTLFDNRQNPKKLKSL